MKIAEIEFPEPLCAALRDGKLVVFAGAGVSMGEPANLPNFHRLARMIAEGTGQTLQNSEPVDRFLGRLERQGVNVHARAAQVLSQDDPQPTELHRDLLRLCSTSGKVHIVTTNFDLLFEQAIKAVFDFDPEVFRSPALPLGQRFEGIVHVHGMVHHHDGMVLTDRDFGRAYLTEGWARRFLVELFREFTVLFVGYGHNDTVMHYLARALPEGDVDKRFALTGKSSNDLQHWRVLGIEPIIYRQSSKHDHSKLHEGLHRLAKVFSRGVLDWKRVISDLAGRKPPLGAGEEADLISEVLKDETKTRFFTEIALSPEWIGWLDKRKHLDALFGTGTLSLPDGVLARWLTERFAHQHANELFLLIARHDTSLHPDFWERLGWKTCAAAADPLDKDNLSRWVSLLLATAPVDADEFVLAAMGERCARNGLVDNLLQVFNAMAGSRLLLKPSFERSDDGSGDQGRSVEVTLPLVGGHYELLNSLWEESLRPCLAQVAEPLLEIVIRRLEEQHLTLSAWQKATREWDSTSFGRSAIEPHNQDEYPEAVDVLINTARDCLEWLAANQAGAATRWCDQLAGSKVPLLRRLAVHTLSARTELAADQKINWLLKHIGLYDLPAHHEIFQAVKLTYPKASPERRANLVESVLDHRWSDKEFPDKEQLTAYSHFNWLHWLCSAAPDCTLAKRALDEVRSKHPDLEPRDHPDFMHCIHGPQLVRPQSLWTTKQLLARPAQDWLPKLLSWQPTSTELFSPSREGLVLAVQKAAEQNFDWGVALADALAGAGKWDVDLWSGLIWVWSKMELDEDNYRRVLNQLERVELYPQHAREIAEVLCMLVKDQGTPHALKLLPQANKIAAALWDCLDRDEPPEKPDDWLTMAINHAAGVLVEFWLGSLGIWRRQQEPLPKTLSDEYSIALSGIVQDGTLAGRLGRSFLASQFAFLLTVDEAWTKENLLPFFYADSNTEDFQATWDGFLTWGRLNPAVAEHLGDAFLNAVQWINGEFISRRDRFVSYYTTMLGYFAEDPLEEWVPKLFQHGNVEVWHLFASQVQFHLRGMDKVRQQEWWCRWLKRYWENRLQGVPARLESGEVDRMLGWLPDLTAVFPEAVDLTIRLRDQLPTEAQVFGHGVVNRIGKSDSLVQSHPQEVAQLLIYLGKFDSHPFPLWRGGRELIDRLLQLDLSPELKQGLKELRATRGL